MADKISTSRKPQVEKCKCAILEVFARMLSLNFCLYLTDSPLPIYTGRIPAFINMPRTSFSLGILSWIID